MKVAGKACRFQLHLFRLCIGFAARQNRKKLRVVRGGVRRIDRLFQMDRNALHLVGRCVCTKGS
jgi:hypothetical protein